MAGDELLDDELPVDELVVNGGGGGGSFPLVMDKWWTNHLVWLGYWRRWTVGDRMGGEKLSSAISLKLTVVEHIPTKLVSKE